MAAITFDFAPVNGDSITRGTLFSTLQLKAFKVTPTTALTEGRDGTAAQVARELGTTAMLFQVKSDGTSMVVIGDGHAVDAAVIKARVDLVLGEASTVAELTSLYGIA
jgi:hypothetical protein